MVDETQIDIRGDFTNAPSNKVVIKKIGNKIVNVSIAGPRGPRGFPGVENLSEFSDILFGTLNNKDILTYNSTISKWVNTPDEELVDGGNF